jgi:redox-sensitive bicupin YhaK (pirin superfamily)
VLEEVYKQLLVNSLDTKTLEGFIAKDKQLRLEEKEDKEDAGVWIHQDAWFHLGEFDQKTASNYEVKKQGNGVYFFVLEGAVEIQGETLNKRDGFGVWDTNTIAFTAEKDVRLLAMEVPMNI